MNPILDDNTLKLFECRRDEEYYWMGAILVLAENEDEACNIANKFDNNLHKKEYTITEIELKKGFIYDDNMR